MNENKTGLTIGVIVLILLVIAGLFYLKAVNKGSKGEVTPPATPEATSPTPTPAPTTSGQRIQVLSPNSATTWLRGKNYSVRWNTTGIGADQSVYVNIIKTSKLMTDPYAADPEEFSGYELFTPAIFPQGLPQEGTASYTVPQTVTPGTYQILIWSGTTCSVTKPAQRCVFDMSDGLITIK